MNPDQIPDVHWNLANTYHTTNIGHIDTQDTDVSAHYKDVKTLSYAKGDKCGDWCETTLITDAFASQSKHESTICSILPINKHRI